ncbi:hypothetical protein Q8F55_005881 [Vanrija albida]|uniref:Uncharacterized protein n=1 Tax=Vanrija albida TaxID=181172 RepID=A0ABR3Q3N6_9TREE
MAHIVQSLENAVEAGVQGIIGIAEGLVGATAPAPSGSGSGLLPTAKGSDVVTTSNGGSVSAPIPIVASGGENGFAHNAPRSHNGPSPTSLASRLAIVSQDTLVQLADVPSGWIHVQSTYLDAAGGQKRVRSFGLRNVSETIVDVEIGSDLGQQVVFWAAADDEKAPSSSESSTSSLSNSAGSPSLNLSLPVGSTTTVFLAFQPTSSQPASPSGGASTPSTDDGFTPRVLPAGAVGTNTELSPVPRLPSAASTSILSDSGSNAASQSSMSGAGSVVRDASASSRRSDPVHRSFSVHGSILVHATRPVQWDDHAADTLSPPFPVGPQAHQNIALPFFATVCRSFFSAALIDPTTGLATAPQLQSGQLSIDFGCDNVVGTEAHRDIILVNRSEIDLIWNTTVVNARHKDSVWFSLRDLDSENVFGVDNSPEPVPLPALSSRHLRLSLRPLSPVAEFDFDFVISNVHQSGNTVNVRAAGSCGASPHDNTLRILSGTSLDFRQIPDGSWAKKLVIAKNMSDRPIDVHFSATPGYDVVYRLAGVAGEDIDEEMPVRPRDKRAEVLSRTSTKDTRDSGRGRDIASTLRYAASEAPAPSGSGRSHAFTDASSVTTDTRTLNESEDWSAFGVSDRESSIPPSRPLSRVTSRASSYRPTRGDNESDDEDSQHLSANEAVPNEENKPSDNLGDRDIPNQIEELTMRPGTEYRVFAMYRPARDLVNPPDVAGALRSSAFKLFFDWAPSSQRSRPGARTRQAVHCTATSCTSIISIPSGHLIDFGEVTVGASKSTTIQIENLSALSARVEIAAISKVLNTNRNIIVIPPFETVNERIDFFPRRINERYEKQVFVRNLFNRENNQLIEVRSKNVDVYNVTLHSHLYRILTPSGSNFLDFGSVVINSPSVRTVQFQNLTQKPLVLDLTASQPEDVELYVKAGDAPVPQVAPAILAKYNYLTVDSDRPNGNLKERFVESLQDKDQGSGDSKPPSKSKAREKSVTRGAKETDKASIGTSLASTLKKGGRGKHVQLYGNSVTFKDRSLLDDAEYLDLASGLPVAAHRIPSTSKRTQLLESIAHEDSTKLSGQHPKVLKLDFSAAAKANGLYLKEPKPKKTKSSSSTKRDPSTPGRHREPSSVRRDPSTPGRSRDQAPTTPSRVGSRTDAPSSPTTIQPILKAPILKPQSAGLKSPALTGRRIELKGDPASVSDVTKLSPDELIVAIEHHEARRSTQAVTHLTSEEEEQYVRRLLALRKEFQNAVSAAKFVPARVLTVPPGSSRQLVVVMTPNGSTRPHISTRAKRAESRIFIKLMEYDHSLLSSAVGESFTELSELPVRDLVIRSSCVRSVLEVQQSSINFGTCERGEIKSRTIVIHNKSDCVGIFRMRTSGSIASGNLKLGLGRYGVISAFGRKEVASFSFTPTMVGNFQETIAVENVLDSFNDQNVLVKATVRKMPALSLDVTRLDIVPTASGEWPSDSGFVITNTSKTERTFVVEAADAPPGAFADISLSLDEKDAGVALSKVEEEEVEAMLQKLKIARRKNKPDKVAKYEKRLAELGVTTSTPEPERAATDADNGSAPLSGTASPVAPSAAASRCVVVTLQANKKSKILVNLVPGSEGTEAFASTVKVFDRKNTDESVTIDVTAQPKPIEQAPAPSKPTSEDPLNLAIMRHCLELTLKCPVSPTAFCVGSTLFLPTSESLFATLKPYFSTFTHPTTGADAGLILADGYSRQIPGNTHAEANALTNFRERMTELEDSHPEASLPSASEVLAQSECFATMEPCSVRTSGGPSCAHELVRAHVKTVFLGVEEPPDFVQCEGVNILEQGGVQPPRRQPAPVALTATRDDRQTSLTVNVSPRDHCTITRHASSREPAAFDDCAATT